MPRILIVDDHTIVRRGLKEILHERLGPSTIGEAGDAAEALKCIAVRKWDAVVLDIKLPGRSGLELLKDIRRAQPKLPVLVLSVYPEDQYAVRALKAGADGYMSKECAPKELAEAVKKVMSGGKYVSISLAEKLAFDLGTGAAERPLHEDLSDREYEVMCMLASGKTVTEIAKKLSLSVKTISTYRTRLLQKMRLEDNTTLFQYAIRYDLLD